MGTTQITVQEVRPPTFGKKTGIVADSTGKWWRAWPNMLPQFQPGNSYQIDFDSNEYQGKTYNTIKASMPMNGVQQAVPNNRPQYSAPPPMTSQTSVDDNKRRLDIFVCGAFNNLMSNPNVDPAGLSMMEMIDILHKFKGAWNGVFGPSPLPRRNDPIGSGVSPAPNDMNDDIPF